MLQKKFIENYLKDKKTYALAFSKLKMYYQSFEGIYNLYDVAKFEANFSNEVAAIIKSIELSDYKLDLLLKVERPKKFKNKIMEIRDYYEISIKDQLVWIVIVNLISPYFEVEMPAWSFGNRINISIFKNTFLKSDGNWVNGFYGYSGNLYKKWYNAWKNYSNSVSLTSKYMFNPKFNIDENDENDENIAYAQLNSKQLAEHLMLDYFNNGYFIQGNIEEDYIEVKNKEVYFAKLDFAKFYSKIKINILRDFLIDTIGHKFEESEMLKNLISALFYFKCDSMENIGLPTGLAVSGFLANVYTLNLDNKLKAFAKSNKIAIFKFVDDYTILSNEFEKIIEVINFIQREVVDNSLGIELSEDKYQPKSLADYLKILDKDNNNQEFENQRKESFNIAKNDCFVDRLNPKQLRSNTSNKLYAIANTNYDLESVETSEKSIADLLQLFSTELMNDEIEENSKNSFILSKLNTIYPYYRDLLKENSQLDDLQSKINERQTIEQDLESCLVDKGNVKCEKYKTLKEKLELIENIIKEKQSTILYELKKKLKYKPNHLFVTCLNIYRNSYGKIDMWKQLISFVRNNGVSLSEDIEMILFQIFDTFAENSKARFYLVKYILSVLLNNVIEAKSLIFEDNSPIADIENNKKFIEFSKKLINKVLEKNIDTTCKETKILLDNLDASLNINLEEDEINSNNSFIFYEIMNRLNCSRKFCEFLNNKIFDKDSSDIFILILKDLNIEKGNNAYIDFVQNLRHKKIPNSYLEKIAIEFVKIVLKTLEGEDSVLYNKKTVNKKDLIKLVEIFTELKEIYRFDFNLNVNYFEEVINAFVNMAKLIPLFKSLKYEPKLYAMAIMQILQKDTYINPLVYNNQLYLLNSHLLKSIMDGSNFSHNFLYLFHKVFSRKDDEVILVNVLQNKLYVYNQISKNFNLHNELEKYLNEISSNIKIEDNKQNIKEIKLLQLMDMNGVMVDENVDINESLKLGIVQINFKSRDAWITKNRKSKNDVSLEMDNAMAHQVWQQIQESFVHFKESNPHIVIFPEVSLPNRYEKKFINLCNKTNVIGIIGKDFVCISKTDEVENKCLVVAPSNAFNDDKRYQSKSYNKFYVSKRYPASIELDYFELNNYNFVPSNEVIIFDMYKYGRVGIMICSDIFDLEKWKAYQGEIHNLIIVSYNKDTETFLNFSRSIARACYCNVTVCNCGEFGNSIVTSLFKETYRRDIYNEKGLDIFNYQVINVPLKAIDVVLKLREYDEELTKKMEKTLKSLPPPLFDKKRRKNEERNIEKTKTET